MRALPRPRNDFVLVKRVQPEAMSAGGLHIPDSARENRMETIIVAIGPGGFDTCGVRCEEAMADLAVGQRVFVGKYGGVPVEGLVDHILVRESELLAVLDKPKQEGQ
jgi:chaperonin GroES